MAIKTHNITTYTIDDHPNPSAVYDWVRSNWHDLGDYCIEESVESLKAFADHFGASLDYRVSLLPDRGEFITLQVSDDVSGLSGISLRKHFASHGIDNTEFLSGNCPLTGVCYDEVLLDVVREFVNNPQNDINFDDLLAACGDALLSTIHAEGEYIYSDDGLRDLLEANEYEFNVDGSFYG